MAKYRIEIRYSNPNQSSAYLVRGDGNSTIECLCTEILELHSRRLERLESLNVFVSKRMEGCSESILLEDDVQVVDHYGDLILPPGYVQLLSSGTEL